MLTHLSFSDLMHYKDGRDVVCEVVLEACRKQMRNRDMTIGLDNKIFTELGFTFSEIILILFEIRKILLVQISFTLILQQNKDFTVRDLGEQIWKYTSKIIKYN